jgi:hypothetical protein
MQEFVESQRNTTNPSQPSITIMPVPWPMSGGPIQTPTGVHYPPVPPVTDYQPSMVPRQQVRPPEPNQILYQNIINTVKEVIDRRSPSQREEPLKPSQIDSKLKGHYTRRPRIPSSNIQSAFMQRPPLPSHQQQQQQRRRRSSQMSTPSIATPPPPPASNIPVRSHILQ